MNIKIADVGLDLAKNSFRCMGLMNCATWDWRPVRLRIIGQGNGSSLAMIVKLIPAQRVKAFLPRMKNDSQDAKARALRDPELRFVGVKSD